MEKVYGSPVRQDGLYKIGRNKWELIYGFGKDNEADSTGWNWRKRYARRPSLEEIKEEIVGAIKEESAHACATACSGTACQWNTLRSGKAT